MRHDRSVGVEKKFNFVAECAGASGGKRTRSSSRDARLLLHSSSLPPPCTRGVLNLQVLRRSRSTPVPHGSRGAPVSSLSLSPHPQSSPSLDDLRPPHHHLSTRPSRGAAAPHLPPSDTLLGSRLFHLPPRRQQRSMPPVPEIYSTDYWSPLVTTLYLFSICALSCMLSKRLPMWGEWKGTSLARIAIVFVLADRYVRHTCLGWIDPSGAYMCSRI